jgi:hypothetical protein
MATVDDLRRHVLDDTIELIQTVGIVSPLVTDANISDPAKLMLRKLLSRRVGARQIAR